MKTIFLLLQRTVLIAVLAIPALHSAPRVIAATTLIYGDSLSQGWSDWSWATVNLQNSSPVHTGSRSIAVQYTGGWQGLYLHNPELQTSGFSGLRFFIHGGSQAGQHMNMHVVLGGATPGPEVALPVPSTNSWQEVIVPLADLGASGTSITGLVWQSASGSAQPIVYLDDIALVSNESADGPILSESGQLPNAVHADGTTVVVVHVKVTDPQGPNDLASVTLDASSVGSGYLTLLDNGHSNDRLAKDGVYGVPFTIAPGTSPGEYKLVITAQDQAGHTASQSLSTLVVLASPPAPIPAVLPARLGWGSNAWSEQAGQDWQVNSGVPWDYIYQYITYGWETWGGSFVKRFVWQAWSKNYIPMVTVYMMLGLPPTCGESPACYAQKLQNPAAVQAYLDALQRAALEAKGDRPVIFNLEPDFYGYMQQYSHQDNRPAGVNPDDPNSYAVALNVAGYPNTLAGFGRRVVDVVHAAAPNALVAPMASMWATNGDPQAVTSAQAIAMGKQTAAFIDAMGGAQADLLIVEWSDRDSGSGLRPWWDDTDLSFPRPTRAVLWENALASTAHKRLMLWQVPVGNMALNNTCDHYQDNRAAYLFRHPRDLFDAGIIGVLFGGGAECMTNVSTDGGYLAAQGKIAYQPPTAPENLTADAVSGAVVELHWDENVEPDLWGYRLVYQPIAGGSPQTMNVSRRNNIQLLLPEAGSWHIQVEAYDAMGRTSPLSATITVTTTASAERVYLPLLRH